MTFLAIRMVPDSYDLYLFDVSHSHFTPEMRSFAKRREKWIKYFRGDNKGCATNWNKIIRATKKDYVLLMSSDAVFIGGGMRVLEEYVKSRPEVDLFPIQIPGMFAWLIKRKSFDELGGFDERFFVGGEDQDYLLRSAKKGHKILIIPKRIACHLEGGHTSAQGGARGEAQIFKKKWGFLPLSPEYKVILRKGLL